jgi:RNA polymerase sigma-70 factor (ECF subfamily)
MAALTYFATVTMETESAEIARGLSRRDPDLLSRLIEQYQHRLFRYLVHLTGDRQLAEDLFQDTWLRVLEKGKSYDGRSEFAPWLLRLARNLTIDHFRRHKMLSLDELSDPEREAPLQVPDQRPTPFDNLASHQDSEKVLACLGGLAAQFREVVVLRFQEEMSLEEIAAVVAIPVATVKSRLYRALDMLGTRLERHA